ncbi:MAG: TSUP family transporter, partial [Myxococcota bacterium]|nr:TSUP family transporter [Myxococcota bacterium]
MLSAFDYLFIGLAALLAGAVNAFAGGGTLLSFPALLALGVPPVSANLTTTLALCPGYLGGCWAQRHDLLSQRHRVAALLPAAIIGGAAGGMVLLLSLESAF